MTDLTRTDEEQTTQRRADDRRPEAEVEKLGWRTDEVCRPVKLGWVQQQSTWVVVRVRPDNCYEFRALRSIRLCHFRLDNFDRRVDVFPGRLRRSGD